MKVFISCPFNGILDNKTNLVKEEYRNFFSELVNFFETNNVDYYLAITRERWGKDYVSPNDSVFHDYEGIKSSDILFVIPGDPISGGVHIELGWASALEKKIHIFLEKDKKYSPVLMGLSAITNVNFHYSDGFPSNQLLKCIIEQIKKEVQ